MIIAVSDQLSAYLKVVLKPVIESSPSGVPQKIKFSVFGAA